MKIAPKSQLLLLDGHSPEDFSESAFLLTEDHASVWQCLVDWAHDAPDAPHLNRQNGGINGLALVGAAGSGKTHLARIWQLRTKSVYLVPEDFSLESLPRLVDQNRYFILDPLTKLSPQAEQNLFHFLGILADLARRHEPHGLLITAPQAPIAWPIALPDLASRLRAMSVVHLPEWRPENLALVLVKFFHDRQIQVNPEVIGYILTHAERSVAALRRVVGDLDELALVQRKPITLALVRDYFKPSGLFEPFA
ncbi:MAG: hypothetical protein QM537_06650 [Candidatus Symbiobacter sp.]|nr:hypothetical protein [Candidatus Symbiobacter sp.]